MKKTELEISLISSFYFLNTNEKVLYQTNEFLIILIVFSFPHKFKAVARDTVPYL